MKKGIFFVKWNATTTIEASLRKCVDQKAMNVRFVKFKITKHTV